MRFDNITSTTILFVVITLTLTLVLYFLISVPTGVYNEAHALNETNIPNFNFAAAGDFACKQDARNTLNNIVHKDPELVLGLGDFAYNNSDCWIQLIDPIYQKMRIVIGNHDHLAYTSTTDFHPSPQRLHLYMSSFNLTNQFYSFNYQNVHFVAMSTEIPYEKGSKQYDFVKNDLQKTVTNSSIDWIVVFYHRIAYGSPTLIHPIKAIRDTYHPLFEKYGVDLILQGHAHNYQRSYPIKFNAEASLKPFIADKNTTDYYNPGAQIFAIVGTGGAPDIHNFTGPAAPYTATQFNAYGFLNIDVLQNGTKLEGNFYENNGTVKDHFSIVKPRKENKETDSSYVLSSSPSHPSSSSSSEPRLVNGYERKFKIESVATGLETPSDMTYLGPQDILVLDKRNGIVHRVVNGNVLEKPLLDVSVANKIERGLLGAAVLSDPTGPTNVFLFYTESKRDGNDVCPKLNYCTAGTEPLGNRLYRYELTKDGTKLIKPKLLIDLPATPGPGHNGGKMIVDSDRNILLIAGDAMATGSKAQNYEDGYEPVGTGGILKIDSDGSPVGQGLLGSKYPLNLYYAYGIRNGFGLDFDPVTGNLWDTENGPDFGDEINLVKPGFNSGWKDVQGFWNQIAGKAQNSPINLNGLEDFDGRGKYSGPEFTWNNTVAPTAVKFFNSNKLGQELENDMFVATYKGGLLYHFDLDSKRTELLLNGTLSDKVANTPDELKNNIFAEGFGAVTDLEVGPDGYLYVLSYGTEGAIYRIVPI